MLHALITQREGHNMYGKYTDVLEAAYVEFYESLGIRLQLSLEQSLRTSRVAVL